MREDSRAGAWPARKAEGLGPEMEGQGQEEGGGAGGEGSPGSMGFVVASSLSPPRMHLKAGVTLLHVTESTRSVREITQGSTAGKGGLAWASLLAFK